MRHEAICSYDATVIDTTNVGDDVQWKLVTMALDGICPSVTSSWATGQGPPGPTATRPLSEKSVHFPWIRNLPHKGGKPECNRTCKVIILFIFLIQDCDQLVWQLEWLEWLDDDGRLLKVLLGMQTVLMSWFKVGKLCGSERGALIVSIMFHDLVQRNNATTMESWTQHWVVRLGKFSTPSHNVTERGRDQLKKKLQLVLPPPLFDCQGKVNVEGQNSDKNYVGGREQIQNLKIYNFVLVKLPLFVDCSGRQRKEGRDCLPCH